MRTLFCDGVPVMYVADFKAFGQKIDRAKKSAFGDKGRLMRGENEEDKSN